jgi:tripeptidyl-peptidase-2
MLFDGNKQLLAQSDPVYPGTFELKKKADHTLRVAIRHDSASLLDRLKAVPLVLERQLDSPLPVPVYASNADAMTGGKTVEVSALLPGAVAAVFLGPLPDDKLPKDAVAGKSLVGTLSLGLSGSNGSAAPGKLPIRLSCAPAKEGDANNNGGGDSKVRPAALNFA